MSENVEETNSGISLKGSWKEVSEFGEKVERRMEKAASGDAVNEFSWWRPKPEEAENDLQDKTIEEATLEERKIEAESKGLDEFKHATRNVKKASRKAVDKEVPDEEVSKASQSIIRPVISAGAKAIRRLEEIAYSKVLLRSDRWYFDSEEFSADMKSTRDGEYQMDVNVSGKEERKQLQEHFKDE